MSLRWRRWQDSGPDRWYRWPISQRPPRGASLRAGVHTAATGRHHAHDTLIYQLL